MAGRQRPSFLKRQKEIARTTRAAEKREARRARRQDRLSGANVEPVTPGLDESRDESETPQPE